MIKQILNNDQIVQTRLSVDVNNIRVYYESLPDKFGYTFHVFLDDNVTCAMADTAIEDVISAMIWQSDDHGSRWCRVSKETFTDDYGVYTANVVFRIRDSY